MSFGQDRSVSGTQCSTQNWRLIKRKSYEGQRTPPSLQTLSYRRRKKK
jgi:hypothetical protein